MGYSARYKDYIVGGGPGGTRTVTISIYASHEDPKRPWYHVKAHGWKNPGGPGRAFGTGQAAGLKLGPAIYDAIIKALEYEENNPQPLIDPLTSKEIKA